MRDSLTIVLLAAWVSVSLFHPWLGIMGWTAVSIMNPHRYSWAASDLPVAMIMVLVTFAALFVTRDRIRPFISAPLVLLGLFVVWICITLPFSIYLSSSFGFWKQVIKIDFMIFVAAMILTTRTHIMGLVWVLVISLGFYGFKGGIFTIAHGGDYRVWGPPESFIEGNNELALALVMIIPLMRFLQLRAKWVIVRHFFTLAMLLTAVSALGTHSRGALLAIVGMAIVLWSRTKHKAIAFVILFVIGVALIAFMPGEWEHRMASILKYEKDESAMGRINAWWMAWNLASDRFFGGGFDIYRLVVFEWYAPNPADVHAAHSIYFQVLGEHGFVGLALFLAMWFASWRSAGWLRREGPKHPDSAWTADLGSMIQASLAGYAVGGAFLSLAYFDLPYNLLLLAAVTKQWVLEKGWERDAETAALRSAQTRSEAPPLVRPTQT